ncbi:PP2C family protein-serine/threonine phosphatase [Sphingopyxis sp. LARHCG72]
MSLDAGAAVATSQGPHRERNEDRCAIVRFRFGSMRPDLRLGILCDGMGGMAKGGEAASLALGAFIAEFATIDPDCPLHDRLDKACRFANVAVYNSFRGEAGTTLTAIAFGVSTRWAVHVGDSRLYGLDDRRQIDLLTQDDTVSGAVNAHLGQSDEDDMDNRLLQFVGIGDTLDPHLMDVSQDWDHSLWLLTSDGAHSVGRKVLAGVCEGSKNPLDLVRKLVFVSEAINTQDNATAICIRSGHVKSSDEEHEGLTIQITAPDRNLDIWLPPSVIKIPPIKEASTATIETADVGGNDSKIPLPRAARTKKSRANRKKRGAQKSMEEAKDSELPMDVIFQIGDEND